MEKKKVSYRMDVNNFVSENEAEYSGIYSYGSVKDILVRLKRNSATIEFVTGTKHTHKELIEKFPNYYYLIDALRKIHIIHALKYEQGLEVEKICLSIDNKDEIIDRSNKYAEDFPFVYSMLHKTTLDLGEKWQDKRILDFFLQKSKSAVEDDDKVASLYSLMLASGKEYEIEKFTNLWTAFNAYYNHYCKDKRTDNGAEISGERNKLSRLLKDFGYGEKIATKGYYSQYKAKYQHIMYCAARITDEEIAKLYATLLDNVKNPSIKLPESGMCDAIVALTKQLKNANRENPGNERIVISPLGLLTFDYAYYLRCKYVHGNKPTLLFSSGKSGEISILRIINYLLKRFLKEHLAEMFITDIIKDEKTAKVK